MKKVTPTVELVSLPQVPISSISIYLRRIGVSQDALERIQEEMSKVSSGERLTMFGGKLCYNSFEAGLNPNVSKVREDSREYLDNILKSGHGSVLEHANFSFIFSNVSRVLTHELVRHRAGCAMSQESLRYVRPTELKFWMPTILSKNMKGSRMITEIIEEIEAMYSKLEDIYAIKDMKNFDEKKKLTSALRRILPQGMGTAILFTMNLRAARHIIQLRTARHAEEEIRILFDEVGRIMQDNCPLLMADMTREVIDGIGEWRSKYPANPYDSGK